MSCFAPNPLDIEIHSQIVFYIRWFIANYSLCAQSR